MGDALVSAATGLAPETIRKGRRELAVGDGAAPGPIRRPGAGRLPGAGPTGPDDGIGAVGRSAHAGRSDVAAALDL